MENFVVNFRKREETLEADLVSKDVEMKQLKDKLMNMTQSNFGPMLDKEELKDNPYVRFIEKRLDES